MNFEPFGNLSMDFPEFESDRQESNNNLFSPNGDIISVLIKKPNSLYWEERDDEIVEGNILWFENGTKDDSYLNSLVRILYLY